MEVLILNTDEFLNPDEIECNLDDDIDDEHYTGRNINNSVSKLRDFSSLNPTIIRANARANNSVMIPSKSFNRESLPPAKQ